MDVTGAIVLVEDNEDDVELTMRALKRNNITNRLVVCRDGAEAVDVLLSDERIRPAVILLDLKLPKVSGLEVLKQLRRDPGTQTLPVVILTSSREEEDLVRGYDLGANSYIRKPVAFDEFMDAIRQIGLYWLLLNETPPVTQAVRAGT